MSSKSEIAVVALAFLAAGSCVAYVMLALYALFVGAT
jgi:hypothetical protein